MANDDDDIIILSDSEDQPEEIGKTNGDLKVVPVDKDIKKSVEDEATSSRSLTNGSQGTTKVNGASSSSSTDEECPSAAVESSEDNDLQFIEEILSQPVQSSADGDVRNGAESEGLNESPDKTTARIKLDDLFCKLRNASDIKLKQRQQIKEKYFRLFEKVDFNEQVKDEFLKLVDVCIDKVQTKGKTPWKSMDIVQKFMKEHRAGRRERNETDEEREERKRRERIGQLERALANLGRKIKEWDEREVDWDEEENSSYMVRSRMIKQYNKCYKLLCKATASSYSTGRPIEKRIKLREVTRFPELDKAVEDFMNSQDVLFVPDIFDIENIVIKINKKSHPPLLAEEDIRKTAKELFVAVMRIMKKRRHQDFKIAMDFPEAQKPEYQKDPADESPELRKKLEENAKNRITESEIIDKFAREQEEQKEESIEVDEEDANRSAPESDDEEEEDDDDAGSTDTEVPEGRVRRDMVDSADEDDDDDEEEDISSQGPSQISTKKSDTNEDVPSKKQKLDADNT